MNLLDAFIPQRSQRAPARALSPTTLTWMDTLFNDPATSAGLVTTMPGKKAEVIPNNFVGYVQSGLQSNGVISAVELVRINVFSEARFQFRRLRQGRPGDLFGNADLAPLETPSQGVTTGDLLARMLLDADFAGNAYVARDGDELLRLRPDWTEIIFEERRNRDGSVVGKTRVGYLYYEGGRFGPYAEEPAVLAASEVAHFAPYPDPLASFRGMSWLTPVVREIMGDGAATDHKLKFFENAATPNLAVSLKETISPAKFEEFIEKMDDTHGGIDNAYRTLYLGGGADVTVIGADMRQLDFKITQGAGETRIAAASGVGAVLAQLSEGLAGSSLNQGNFAAARRRLADVTMRPLWRNVSGSLATLVTVPSDAELWFDARDIAFLREDEGDAANIQKVRAETITALIREGFTPKSAVAAVENDDFSLLEHTGFVSVQLHSPDETPAPAVAPGVMPSMNGKTPKAEMPAAEVDGRAVNVNVHNYPQSASVEVRNEVNPTPVTVGAPNVTVENNVEPTPVEVRNVVMAPSRKPGRLEYDDEGRIVRIVEEG